MNRFYLATASASLPSVVAEDQLLIANSMAAVGGTVTTFLGFGVGTQLADQVGARPLILAMVRALRAGGAPGDADPEPAASQGSGRPASPGRRVGRVPRSGRGPAQAAGDATRAGHDRLPGAGPGPGGDRDGAVAGGVPGAIRQGVASYGRIIAAGGVGILAGILTVGILESRLPKVRIVALGSRWPGSTCLALAPVVTGLTMLIVSFVLGLTFAYRKIPADTIVQESVPDRYRGRVFSAYDFCTGWPGRSGSPCRSPSSSTCRPAGPSAWWARCIWRWTFVVPVWVRRARTGRIRFDGGRDGGRDPAGPGGGRRGGAGGARTVLPGGGRRARRRRRLGCVRRTAT